ncbi:MAG: hypothetical protein R2770_20670 [Acidimicrobiales bacterium]
MVVWAQQGEVVEVGRSAVFAMLQMVGLTSPPASALTGQAFFGVFAGLFAFCFTNRRFGFVRRLTFRFCQESGPDFFGQIRLRQVVGLLGVDVPTLQCLGDIGIGCQPP